MTNEMRTDRLNSQISQAVSLLHDISHKLPPGGRIAGLKKDISRVGLLLKDISSQLPGGREDKAKEAVR